jgi:antitoxin component YwqK of YwqJK toxin-antitoxin module
MATLTEHKSKYQHYFEDENGHRQGESKWWHSSGQLGRHCYYVDGKLHGEYKWWNDNGKLRGHCFYVDGKLNGEYKTWHDHGQPWVHCFYQNGEVVIDFFKDPDLCPVTDEVKTYFALKYGSGKWLP